MAAGHGRELALSQAFQQGLLTEFVALDHDLGQFDLIYSAGLYDYLETPVAERLPQVLFDLLNPGGQLLYANFAPDIPAVGYIEEIMDWWLIYRDAAQTLALPERIDASQISRANRYSDLDHNIHFVELKRAMA